MPTNMEGELLFNAGGTGQLSQCSVGFGITA